jgi:DNA polymerase III epsilon subunit family exonuclease
MIFDTETTGLIDNSVTQIDLLPEIIEFYGCRGRADAELDLLIKPAKRLPQIITKITGLEDEDLVDKPCFAEVADEIRAFIEGSDEIVAHNASFDMEIVDIEFRRLGQTITWPKKIVCTVEQTVHLKGRRMSLTNLYEYLFGEAFPDAHRARHDVAALTRCYDELILREEI